MEGTCDLYQPRLMQTTCVYNFVLTRQQVGAAKSYPDMTNDHYSCSIFFLKKDSTLAMPQWGEITSRVIV